MNLHDSGILLDFLFHFRILESAHHVQDGKTEQRFERLAFQLVLNKSWKEKVVLALTLAIKNVCYFI